MADWRKLENEEAALRLDGQHEGGRRPRTTAGSRTGHLALALAQHRLPQPVDLPMLKEYGAQRGSTSTRRPPPKTSPPSSTISHSRPNSTPSTKPRLKTEGPAGESGSGIIVTAPATAEIKKQQEDRPGLAVGLDEVVGEMIVVLDPNCLAGPAPNEDHETRSARGTRSTSSGVATSTCAGWPREKSGRIANTARRNSTIWLPPSPRKTPPFGKLNGKNQSTRR